MFRQTTFLSPNLHGTFQQTTLRILLARCVPLEQLLLTNRYFLEPTHNEMHPCSLTILTRSSLPLSSLPNMCILLSNHLPRVALGHLEEKHYCKTKLSVSLQLFSNASCISCISLFSGKSRVDKIFWYLIH